MEGDAETGGDENLVFSHGEGLRKLVKDFLRYLGDRVLVGEVLEDEGEFVPAQTGQSVAATRAGLEPLRHLVQQFVPFAVAQRVVDDFETVKVHEDRGKRGVVAVGLGQAVFEAVAERHPVGQAGEGVMTGEVPDPLLGEFQFGDFREYGHVIGGMAGLVGDDADVHPGGKGFAVLAPVDDLSLPLPGFGKDVLDGLEKG